VKSCNVLVDAAAGVRVTTTHHVYMEMQSYYVECTLVYSVVLSNMHIITSTFDMYTIMVARSSYSDICFTDVFMPPLQAMCYAGSLPAGRRRAALAVGQHSVREGKSIPVPPWTRQQV